MSADLFAEFGNFSAAPSSTSQPNTQASQAKSQLPPAANDPWAFLASPTSHTASPQTLQPPQIWPATQSHNHSSGAGSWGSFGATGTTPNGPAKQVPKEDDDDDDAWGDFEEAAPSARTASKSANVQTSRNNLTVSTKPTPVVPEPSPRTRVIRASTMDMMTNNLIDIAGPAKQGLEPWQERPSWEKPSVKPPGPKSPVPEINVPSRTARPQENDDPDVLFDADDFDEKQLDEDDDFGDFETGDAAPEKSPAGADLLSLDFGTSTSQTPSAVLPVSAPTQQTRKAPPSQLLSTLSLTASPLTPTSPYPQAPKSPAFSERNPFPGLAVTTPVSGTFPKEAQDKKEESPTPITAWPEAQSAKNSKDSFDEKDWDAFPDFPPDAATTGGPSVVSRTSTWSWDALDSPQPAPKAPKKLSSSPESIGPPPTNIPPPSILLSIIPQLLQDANAALYKPIADQPAPIKSRVLSDPATLAFLRGYILLAMVAARILVGRKLRWHRDKFLSQGMTISVVTGGKGGMKLAGVDKTQSAREDAEAADVVGVWRDHVGKLRSAVAAANLGLQRQAVKTAPLKVPEINDHMTIQTAKMVPTAPKACVVCGLKRDERVKGVDFEVEDSFGEWWVEHWGHRACRNFWSRHEAALRQR